MAASVKHELILTPLTSPSILMPRALTVGDSSLCVRSGRQIYKAQKEAGINIVRLEKLFHSTLKLGKLQTSFQDRYSCNLT